MYVCVSACCLFQVISDLERIGVKPSPVVSRAVTMIDSWALLTGRYVYIPTLQIHSVCMQVCMCDVCNFEQVSAKLLPVSLRLCVVPADSSPVGAVHPGAAHTYNRVGPHTHPAHQQAAPTPESAIVYGPHFHLSIVYECMYVYVWAIVHHVSVVYTVYVLYAVRLALIFLISYSKLDSR